MIWIVRINEILPNLTVKQVEAFRLFGEQDEVQQKARQMWTTWMEQHPLTPSTMVTTGASARERGIE